MDGFFSVQIIRLVPYLPVKYLDSTPSPSKCNLVPRSFSSSYYFEGEVDHSRGQKVQRRWADGDSIDLKTAFMMDNGERPRQLIGRRLVGGGR